jgi:hypothetical protein
MKAKIVLGALAISLFSLVAVSQEVSVNYVHNKSFAQYHTYAWGGGNQNKISNSILGEQAQTDVDNALQAKGLQKVQEGENPDLIVTVGGGAKEQTSYDAWGFGWGMGGEITPEQSVEGTLIVNLYDAKAKSLIWRGIAEKTLDKNGNKNQKAVSKAIDKMFKKWPTQ